MKLGRRAFATIALVFATGFAGASVWLGVEGGAAARASATRHLDRGARLAEAMTRGRVYDDALADSLGAIAGLRVTLIGPDGTVVGDSEVPTRRLPEVENHADRPEVRAALAGAPGFATRESETVALSLLYYAIPTDQGALRLSVSAEEVLGPVRIARRVALVVLAGLLIAVLLVLRHVSNAGEAQLEQARGALGRIGTGELEPLRDPDVSGPLGPEIAGLADRLRRASAAARGESDDLRAVFDGLEDGIAFIDGRGAVSLCNPAFERWAGRSIPPGSRFAGLFRTPRISEAVDLARAGRSLGEELIVGERTLLLSSRPHRGGALLLLRDVTALRKLEGVRRDFVANVSHELKTPLTSVVGFAEAIASGDLPAQRVDDFGERILANATRMRRLVDDLLDLSIVESGSWRPSPTTLEVGAVAREVWSTLSPARDGIRLEIDAEDARARAHADPEALAQIFRNLLDNAARHCEGSCEIRVRAKPEGPFVRIEVSDAGAGIPSAHLDRVFERFYRVDPARSREEGGTGLGLAIVKHLVVGHGGEVGIESTVGRGTTVWFTLPSSSE